MKRLWKIALCLALALIALTSCSGGEQSNSGSQIYAEATQYLGPVAATETPTEAPQETAAPSDGGNNSGGVSIFDNPYLDEESISPEDALSEEIIAGHIALGDDVRLYVNGDHKIGFEKMVQPEKAVFPALTE